MGLYAIRLNNQNNETIREHVETKLNEIDQLCRFGQNEDLYAVMRTFHQGEDKTVWTVMDEEHLVSYYDFNIGSAQMWFTELIRKPVRTNV